MSKRLWARSMWSRVAYGEIDENTREWLRNVARRMLDADELNRPEQKNARTAAMIAATDLTGKVDQAMQDRLWAIFCYGEQYPTALPENPPLRDFLCQFLHWHDISDETADRRIRSAVDSLSVKARAQYNAILARSGRKPRREI